MSRRFRNDDAVVDIGGGTSERCSESLVAALVSTTITGMPFTKKVRSVRMAGGRAFENVNSPVTCRITVNVG